ncbi:hypothetical protein GCM10008090_31540 [Arenicella chitinivorans]|uniref:Uncharacterized protein n=1 Tax=Arenicella chitinivorans TaxID=1329800 RepID=A0A918VSS9_9GAMM|nr:hypothetical protein GCM10008090_31540 [Arenicella chitinivorans]
MELSQRIEHDFSELDKFFKLVSDAIESEPEWSYLNASARFTMITDLYGCLEFWLRELCNYHQNKFQLSLSHKDIRSDNDLSAYNKYLCKVSNIDIAPVHNAYCDLQNLRKVRNIIVHGGAHTNDDKISSIKGVGLFGSLITVSNDFVHKSKDSAKCYLIHIANA